MLLKLHMRAGSNALCANVMIGAHRTSICLQQEFWDILNLIASDKNFSFQEVFLLAKKLNPALSGQSALRVLALKYAMDKTTFGKTFKQYQKKRQDPTRRIIAGITVGPSSRKKSNLLIGSVRLPDGSVKSLRLEEKFWMAYDRIAEHSSEPLGVLVNKALSMPCSGTEHSKIRIYALKYFCAESKQ